MTNIEDNFKKIKEGLDKNVTLIAVTKTRNASEINQVIKAGATDIGENKVQEIIDKFDKVLPVRWHMIGHLQTNKVKYIIDKVSLIHSVDSMKLAEEINKRAAQKNITMDVLIQVNPALEESKFGINIEETEKIISSITNKCYNIRIKGLMCIAPYAENPEDIAKYFEKTKKIFDKFKVNESPNVDFEYLSMGMSNDYVVAIKAGANMIRVGSSIFGERIY